MTTGSHPQTDRRSPRPTASIFDRVLVGVDGTEAGFDACRQAARLAEPDSTIEAAAVVHLGPAVAAAYDTAKLADNLELEADAALARALEILGDRAQKRYLAGFVTLALLDEIEQYGATLLALGTHGHHRTAEILLGGVAGEMLHRSPCSILVARPADAETFPRAIAVGVDGSPPSLDALHVAGKISARFDVPLSVVMAHRGDIDVVHAELASHEVELVDGSPVDALVEAAREGDLLVVGSRGLHGVLALGSVSERVAHQAGCSVLVVRNPVAHTVERPC